MKKYIQFDKIKPTVDIFFIIGMSGTGKTTISNKLSKKINYKLISVDEIIRDISKTHPDKMKITRLYNPNKYMKEKNEVIKRIKIL